MNGWIINAQVFTSGEIIGPKDVLIENGRIQDIGRAPEEAEVVLDAKGRLLSPGLVDVHVHLREPGGEHKETIYSGTKAAAKGGFTTVCPMPNTHPVPDSAGKLDLLYERIEATAVVRVLPYASITEKQQGTGRTNMKALKEHGAFAFTDDGVGVQDASVMYEAMLEAAAVDMPVVAHCEENTLVYGGSVHAGRFAEKNGLKGIPAVAESVHIARDILLAEAAGCHYHVCHVSTKESVRLIRDAKRAGIHVTAEVTPHHLLLSEDDIPEVDTNYKMNPPLRSRGDRQALLEAWLDGTIDFIATDHAPHAAEEKARPIGEAPFGITGFETAFPLLYNELVLNEVCTLEYLLASMTEQPARVFGLGAGTLAPGAAADLTLIDLEHEEAVDPAQFVSKGKNTPFTGWKLKGWPVLTIVDGQTVYEKEEVQQ